MNQNANVPGEWGFRVFASGAGPASSQNPFPDKVSDHEFGQVTYKVAISACRAFAVVDEDVRASIGGIAWE